MLAGVDSVNQRIGGATGARSTTTIEAVLAAIVAIGVADVALLTRTSTR